VSTRPWCRAAEQLVFAVFEILRNA
jgi:hypothetical protein